LRIRQQAAEFLKCRAVQFPLALAPDNIKAACDLRVRPEQERFVAPVVKSIAEAYVRPDTTWPRLILDDDRVVGFVMGAFDTDNEVDAFRAGIWRLNIAAGEQGRGYGRFAVNAIAREARRRGLSRIAVLWERGEGSPEEFYLRLGFRPTGEEFSGEVVGELRLRTSQS
jgi:diamine N-acetyltransferase